MSLLAYRANEMKEVLFEQSGKDPLEDRFRCGYIAAVNDVLRVELEEIQ